MRTKLIFSLTAVFLVGSLASPIHAATVTNRVVAISGQPIPGAPNTFFYSLVTRPVVNARGDVGFIGTSSPPVPVTSGNGVFLERSGVLERVLQGNAARPSSTEALYARFRDLVLNDVGELLVIAYDTQFTTLREELFGNAGGAWRTIVRTGDSAPGLPAGTKFSRIAANVIGPLLRTDGQLGVAFEATTVSTNSGSFVFREGLWVQHAPPSALTQIGAYGGPAQAPGLVGGEILGTAGPLRSIAFSSSSVGTIAFIGQLLLGTGGVSAANDEAIWAGPPLSPSVVLREGPSYAGFQHVALNRDRIAVVAQVASGSGARTDDLISFPLATPLFLVHIARRGDSLPNRSGTFVDLVESIARIAINAAGQVVFEASLQNTTSTPGGGFGLYSWTPSGGIKLVARKGESWPDAPPGWTLESFIQWNVNASGRTAFHGTARSGFSSGQGVWITDAAGTPTLLAQVSIPVGGTNGVLAASSIYTETIDSCGGQDGRVRFLTDTDEVAFSASFSDGRSGIYLGRIGAGGGSGGGDFSMAALPGDASASIRPASLSGDSLLNGSPMGAQLTADPLKNWAGAKARLEIVTNASPSDLLGISGAPGTGVATGGAVSYLGVLIGMVSRPNPTALEITFNGSATTEAVFHVLRSLAYGSTNNLEAALRSNPRHTETNRVLRLRVTDAAGLAREVTRRMEFPKTIGLAFEGEGPYEQFYGATISDTGSHIGVAINVCVQLRLSDGSRVSLPNTPNPAINWTPQMGLPLPRNGIPCVAPGGVESGAYSLKVRFLDWEAKTTLVWDYIPDGSSLSKLVGCLLQALAGLGRDPISPAAFFQHWMGLTPHGQASASVNADFLANPYALREWMRDTSEGRRLIQLYEQHSPELVRIVLTNYVVLNDVAGMIQEFMPGLNQFLAGKGENVVIRSDMIEQLNRVCDAFAAAGSPALKSAIVVERARFHNFEDFSGRSFVEWGEVLQWGAPKAPFVTLSSPRREANSFAVEANRVSGTDYTLQHASSLSPVAWQSVTNAVQKLDEFKLELTDPNAPANALFYRLQLREMPSGQ